MSKSLKGGELEREIATCLSMWWTDGQRDDMLWRSQNSGARATTRGKAGKTLAGQLGDIAATDPDAVPITAMAVWEIKAGYSTVTPHHVFDRKESTACQVWEEWLFKTARAASAGGVPGWCIVNRRSFRTAVIAFNDTLGAMLAAEGAGFKRSAMATYQMNVFNAKKTDHEFVRFYIVTLESFLTQVDPDQWRAAYATHLATMGGPK